jgi:hypothetical protein
MLASFMLSVDFNAVSWEGVKFRGRACQRREKLKFYLLLTKISVMSCEL